MAISMARSHPPVLLAFAASADLLQHRDRPAASVRDRGSSLRYNQHRIRSNESPQTVPAVSTTRDSGSSGRMRSRARGSSWPSRARSSDLPRDPRAFREHGNLPADPADEEPKCRSSKSASEPKKDRRAASTQSQMSAEFSHRARHIPPNNRSSRTPSRSRVAQGAVSRASRSRWRYFPPSDFPVPGLRSGNGDRGSLEEDRTLLPC